MSENKTIAEVKQDLLNAIATHAGDHSIEYLTATVQSYKTLCEAESIEQQTAFTGTPEYKLIG